MLHLATGFQVIHLSSDTKDQQQCNGDMKMSFDTKTICMGLEA
jgi:hypothetical protein